jgi:hypothetical protein
LHAVGNKTRLTNYVETRTEQAPQPLTKTTYGGVCTPTRRVRTYRCGRSRDTVTPPGEAERDLLAERLNRLADSTP